FGYRLVPEEEQGYWRSADQTFFFKGETVHRHTGRWRTDDWDGCAAGQGLIHEERWRNGPGKSSFRSWGRPRRLGD
ncbi:MAG: hypothetical protein KDA80_22360, partial [Planctomycetaceae bacterium]|nr:hypothetical protein [Planctomycetaceae bacterium]